MTDLSHPQSLAALSQPNTTLALDPWLLQERQQYPELPQALRPIICAIASAGQTLHPIVSQLDLTQAVGQHGSCNASGDVQQKLDLIAHHHFVQALGATQEVAAVLSEEAEDMIVCPAHAGEYIVALDPLDGSANIDVHAPIGTIFSIYRRLSPASAPVQLSDVLQAGQQQVAAGYILYGTSTLLVYTAGRGVHGFTYVPDQQTFFLSHRHRKMPEEGTVYAANESHWEQFPDHVQRYLQHCKRQGCTLRYMGALVADFHRHLMQGGIYLYPPMPRQPQGKLRLLLECTALAFIAEQAGGMATTDQQAILAVQPESIHQRTPLYIGSKRMVQALLQGHTQG